MVRLSDLVQGLLDEQINSANDSETTQVPRQPKSTHQPLRMGDFPALRAFCEGIRAVSDEMLALLPPEIALRRQKHRPPLSHHVLHRKRRLLPRHSPISHHVLHRKRRLLPRHR